MIRMIALIVLSVCAGCSSSRHYISVEVEKDVWAQAHLPNSDTADAQLKVSYRIELSP